MKSHAAHFSSGGVVHVRKDHLKSGNSSEFGPKHQIYATDMPVHNDRPVMKSGGWIKGAIKKPGVFKASAKKAGMSTHAFAEKHKHDSGVTGNRARLALTLSKMRKG
jgi:hypothetical protein